MSKHTMQLPVFILLILIGTQTAITAQNLIKNPGLEEGSADQVAGWEMWSYDQNIPATLERRQDNPREGLWYVVLSNSAPDDTRLIQRVTVEPNSIYRLSCWGKAVGVNPEGMGVNLSLRNHFAASPSLFETTEDWEYIEFYVSTDEYSFELIVCLSLGGFASPNEGQAYFDEISLEKIESAPGGTFVIQLESPAPVEKPGGPAKAGRSTWFSLNGRRLSPLSWTLITLFTLWLVLAVFIIVAKKTGRPYFVKEKLVDRLPPFKPEKITLKTILLSPYTKFLFVCLLTFIFLLDLYSVYQGDPVKNFENHYVFQADAFLHGKLDIDRYTYDMAVFNDKNYVIYPPFPVLLLLPFVALFGFDTQVTVVSTLLTLVNLILLYQLLKKVQISRKIIPWVGLAFLFGTAYWFSLTRTGQVYFFAHLAAVFACLLCFNEALGKGRGIPAGLFLGMAFLSRQLTIFLFFFLIFVLWERREGESLKSKILNLFLFCLSLGFCVIVYLAFNYARFGNIFDSGYAYLELADFLTQRVEVHGLFSLAYIPHNFVYLFLQGFAFEFDGIKVSNLSSFGTAITFASPFFFFAFLAKWKKKLMLGAWISIVLIILGQLIYYNNGWIQYNTQRFTLDFIPLLLLLTALGMNRTRAKFWKPAIIFAIVMNAFSVWLLLYPESLVFF